jgi:CheY-like chemotaxis protein
MERKRILIVDDEPEFLNFLFDYFESQGMEVVVATNLSDALDLAGKSKYKLALVDMNIPATGNAKSLLDTPIAQKYPGFKVAHHLRNIGYGAHQVIAYTVHDDDSLDSELDKIRCRYVLKGRPYILKSVVAKALAPKPVS